MPRLLCRQNCSLDLPKHKAFAIILVIMHQLGLVVLTENCPIESKPDFVGLNIFATVL